MLSRLILLLAAVSFGQTLVATTHCSTATANHSQRKIIRKGVYSSGNIINDTLYIFYQDTRDDSNFIMLAKLINVQTPLPPIKLYSGKNPSATIGPNGLIHLVFESDDSLSRIIYSNSRWFDRPDTFKLALVLRNPPSQFNGINKIPAVDVDKSGIVHIVWIEKGPAGGKLVFESWDSLWQGDVGAQYLSADSEDVYDVSIATNLNFQNNEKCIGYSYLYNGTSYVYFDCYGYRAKGSLPCASLNVDAGGNGSEPALIYKDEGGSVYWMNWYGHITEIEGPITYLAIDDIAPPLDFSFIYMTSGFLTYGLHHAHVHTYTVPMYPGGHYNEYMVNISDPIGNNPSYPSIAYKYFNPEIVDIIWMENAGDSAYNIMHIRRPKIAFPNKHENDNKDIKSIFYVSPNPFNLGLSIDLSLFSGEHSPVSLRIFDVSGKLIADLSDQMKLGNLQCRWNASDLAPGLYVVRAACNGKTAEKRVMLLK